MAKFNYAFKGRLEIRDVATREDVIDVLDGFDIKLEDFGKPRTSKVFEVDCLIESDVRCLDEKLGEALAEFCDGYIDCNIVGTNDFSKTLLKDGEADTEDGNQVCLDAFVYENDMRPLAADLAKQLSIDGLENLCREMEGYFNGEWNL